LRGHERRGGEEKLKSREKELDRLANVRKS
jgi:hypothetical protein